MRKGAFTLLETLVATAVIAILTALLVPGLRAAREQSRRIACLANLRQIGQGIWCYWAENGEHVPYVESPFTNGTLVAGFGNPNTPDADLDPFDRQKWPHSLENVLCPRYLGAEYDVFVCPAAVNGWPRRGGPYRAAYRPASINQPNGLISPPGSYFREAFGFLDGRRLKRFRLRSTGDAIRDSQQYSMWRGTFARDLVRTGGGPTFGPHKGGINALNRNLEAQYRDRETATRDLALYGGGVQF